MSDPTPTTRGPIEVLHLAGLCGSGEVGVFNLAQVRFGRDDEGCWAAASNAKILGIARWEAATAVGTEFGVPAAILTESLLADADEFEIGPEGVVIHDGRSPTQIEFAPPSGRWIPTEARCGYERAMREPADAGSRQWPRMPLDRSWCALHRALGLMAAHSEFSIRPYLAMMTGKPGTYRGPLWCFEAVPDVRRVTVWACVMPISE